MSHESCCQGTDLNHALWAWRTDRALGWGLCSPLLVICRQDHVGGDEACGALWETGSQKKGSSEHGGGERGRLIM